MSYAASPSWAASPVWAASPTWKASPTWSAFDVATILGSKLLERWTSESKVYSDAAGTVAAIAGGNVRSVRGQLSNTLALAPANGCVWTANVRNSRPGITMPGTIAAFDATLAIPDGRDFAVFLVGRTTARGNSVGLFGTSTPQYLFGFAGAYSSNFSVAGGTVPADFAVVSLLSRSTGCILRVNGVQVGTAAAMTAGALSAVGFWGLSGLDQYDVFGDQVECIVASGCPTDQQVSDVEALLAAMYPPTAEPGTDFPLTVFAGDSLTYGYGATNNAGQYPDQVAALRSVSNYWINKGVGGRTMTNLLSAGAADVDAHYSAARTINIAVGWGGTNDLANSRTGAAIYADIVTWGNARKAAGFRTVFLTTLKRSVLTAPQETQRAALNALLLADFPTLVSGKVRSGGSWADLLVDVASETNLLDPSNTTYFADGTHLTNAGYAIIAADVSTSLVQLGVA